MMDKTYSQRQLIAVIDGDYMPRERAIAKQCFNAENRVKRLEASLNSRDKTADETVDSLTKRVKKLKVNLDAAEERENKLIVLLRGVAIIKKEDGQWLYMQSIKQSALLKLGNYKSKGPIVQSVIDAWSGDRVEIIDEFDQR